MICWCFQTFELDSRKLLDLGRWFGWFHFECSPILGLKFLKFLEASGLDSSRAFSLLNPVLLNVSGRLLFIGVLGWVSDMWRSSIGDTCHNLIGPLKSSLTRTGLLESSLTRARLLESSFTRVRLLESSLTRARLL